MPKSGRQHDAYFAALRWLMHASCAFVVCAVVVLASKDAEAYPFMIKHGYTNCAGCHADPSGGELLTVYGHAISYEVLSTRFGGDSKASAVAERRAMAALRHAAAAKSARQKQIRAEKVVLDEEPTAKAPPPVPKAASRKAPRKKPARKPPAAEPAAAEPEAEEAEPAEPAEEADASEASDDAEPEAEVAKASKKKSKKKKVADEEAEPSEEDGEETAEEEAGTEEATEETSANASGESGSAAAEPSPYEGMGGLTGPMFGLMKPNERLLLGGSVRLATTLAPDTRFFPMQLDLYGQVRLGPRFRSGLSLGLAKVPAGSPHARAAQVTGNQGDGYNLISRTHWAGFDLGDGAHTVRAGRLNLPYGLRMSEHVMWVRERTQTDRESDQQHGMALYLGFDTFRFELMAILGNFQVKPDQFRERGYSAYAELALAERTMMGASSLYTIADNDRIYTEGLKTSRQAHGLFLRSAVSETVVVLAELDALFRTRRELGYVGFLQVDFEAVQGLHFMGTGELLDAGYPRGGGFAQAPRDKGFGKPQFGAWLSAQWFFLPHFDFRIDTIFRSETQVLGQLHVYL